MAETAIPIYADLTNRKLVASSKGGFINSIPSPFHQDKLYINLQPLAVNPGGGDSAPYTILDGANYAVTVIVVAASGGTVLSGPYAGFVTDGGTGKLGSIDLYTSPMATAMAASSNGQVSCLLQLQFDDGSDSKTTVEQAFTVKKTYITAGTPAELPLSSYLTRDEQMQLFVKFVGNAPGSSIELIDETDTYTTTLKTNSDGTFAADIE